MIPLRYNPAYDPPFAPRPCTPSFADPPDNIALRHLLPTPLLTMKEHQSALPQRSKRGSGQSLKQKIPYASPFASENGSPIAPWDDETAPKVYTPPKNSLVYFQDTESTPGATHTPRAPEVLDDTEMSERKTDTVLHKENTIFKVI